MCIYLVDYTEVTEIGIIVKKDAMKIQGSIAPHPLIITRSFIIVMGFQGLVQIQGHDYWKIKLYVTIFRLIIVFVSIP